MTTTVSTPVWKMYKRRPVRTDDDNSRDRTGGDVGACVFREFIYLARSNGWLVPGQETLTLSLWTAVMMGDETAAYALKDLYSEAGMDKPVDRLVNSGRDVVSRWSEATRNTFLRFCHSKGIYRDADCKGRKAPRTRSTAKLAQSTV